MQPPAEGQLGIEDSLETPFDGMAGLDNPKASGWGRPATSSATFTMPVAPFSGADAAPLHSHVDCLGVGVAVTDDVEQHPEVVGTRRAGLAATGDESDGREAL